MGSTRSEDSLGAALFPMSRRRILAELFGHPERAFYVREIARRTGLGYGHALRELGRLEQGGVLTRREEGRHVYFQANESCPIYEELRSLVVKTFGVVGRLRAALAPLEQRIAVAFVYGSVARGSEGEGSDIDLLVIGDVSLAEVVSAVRREEARLGREVTPTVYTLQEARERRAAHFLRSVIRTEKLFVLGNEDELERLLA